MIIFDLIIFLFGLTVGSFLNCIIFRLETNQSFLIGRSFCPNCKHILGWQDLTPIFSFLILKGKCRYCQKPISWQYPLVEISTAVLFVAVFNPQNFLLSAFYFLLSSLLIIIFVYDLKHYIIPDTIIYPAIIITFFYKLFRFLEFENWNLFGIWNLEFGILKPILSAVLASGFFLIIVLVSRGKWMGIGDIKLAAFMGLFLGFPNILFALFSSFFIGAIIGIGLIISGKKTLKSEIPFGPFLVTGTFLSLFFGEKIINCYLSLFL